MYCKALLVLALTALTTVGAAQPALSGRVLDQNRESLPGARVSVHTISGEAFNATGTTDAAGAFLFDALPDGEYSVCAELHGFVSTCVRPLHVSFPAKVRWDFVLRVANLGSEGGVYSSSDLVGELIRQGQRLSAVKICLAGSEAKSPVCTTTNRLGQYFLSVPPGVYTVTVESTDLKAKYSLDLNRAGEYRNRITVESAAPAK